MEPNRKATDPLMSLASTAFRVARRSGVPRRRALVVLLAALALWPVLFMALMAVCASGSDDDSGSRAATAGGQIHQVEAAYTVVPAVAARWAGAEIRQVGAESARVAGVCDECCPTPMFPACVEVPMQRITIPGLALPAAGVGALAVGAGLVGLLWARCRRRLRFASGAPPLWLLDCVSRT